MKKIILLFCIFFSAKFSFSQHLTYSMYELLHNEDVKSLPVQFDNQYSGILGSGFYSEKWLTGRAFTLAKNFDNLKLKFDTYKNKIFLNTNDTIFDISKSGIIRFDIFSDPDDSAIVLTFSNGYNFEEVTPDIFVNVLANGKLSFVKYLKKDVEEVNESSPYYKEKKFMDKSKYYIVDQEQNGKEVGVNKKNLEKILEPKWAAVNSYAKTNKINEGNEEGWIKLINYYNTLP